jgi:hypothetical protein
MVSILNSHAMYQRVSSFNSLLHTSTEKILNLWIMDLDEQMEQLFLY